MKLKQNNRKYLFYTKEVSKGKMGGGGERDIRPAENNKMANRKATLSMHWNITLFPFLSD